MMSYSQSYQHLWNASQKSTKPDNYKILFSSLGIDFSKNIQFQFHQNSNKILSRIENKILLS